MSNGEIVIAIQRKRLIRAFKRESATSPDRAIYPQEHGIRMGHIFKRLVRQKILVQTLSSRYYYDEMRDSEIRHVKLQVMAAVIVVFLIIALILMFIHH